MEENSSPNEIDKKQTDILRQVLKRTEKINPKACGSCENTGSFVTDLGSEIPCSCVYGYRLRAGIKPRIRQ